MFLAHFSNTPLNTVLDWDIEQIFYWSQEAVKMHNFLNTPAK